MENKTTITSNQVDINNTVGMILDANKAKLYSTNGNVPIFAKCGDKEIKLIDEKGNTYLNSLTVNGKNINSISDNITKVINVFKGAEWSKEFRVEKSDKGDNSHPQDDVASFTFPVPFKGAKYIIACDKMTESLTGNKDSPVAVHGKNGVHIYRKKPWGDILNLDFPFQLIHTFTQDGEYGPIELNDDNILVNLDTQEDQTGNKFDIYGSFYCQEGSCRITLKLSI